jgi:phage shock protein A
MDLEAQIKVESSQAAKYSREANLAFGAKNFAQGKALMKQAVEAGRRCQSLIQQYNQGNTTPARDGI